MICNKYLKAKGILMFHPGLDKEKISDLTEEQILNRINELNIRMNIAQKLGRSEVIAQLRLLLDHYERIRLEKLDAEMQALVDADPKLGRKVIDIDWPDPNEEDEEPKKN